MPAHLSSLSIGTHTTSSQRSCRVRRPQRNSRHTESHCPPRRRRQDRADSGSPSEQTALRRRRHPSRGRGAECARSFTGWDPTGRWVRRRPPPTAPHSVDTWVVVGKRQPPHHTLPHQPGAGARAPRRRRRCRHGTVLQRDTILPHGDNALGWPRSIVQFGHNLRVFCLYHRVIFCRNYERNNERLSEVWRSQRNGSDRRVRTVSRVRILPL